MGVGDSIRFRAVVGSLSSGLLLCGLAACGGGGGGGGGPHFSPIGVGSSSGNSYAAGIFMPSAQFKGSCAAPRPGNADDRQGTTLDEQLWLRSWSNELYLWYSEIPDTNPAGYTTATYFDVLKTSAKNSTGTDKDKFHFTLDTAAANAFFQAGTTVGYGFEYTAIQSRNIPRDFRVSYIDTNAPPAAIATGIARGAKILKIDGVDLVNATDLASIATLNAGLSPSASGQQHKFTILDLGATVSRDVILTSAVITLTPVKISTRIGAVGYLMFTDHIATAESELVSAVQNLQGVPDLVLDIRYNGGGYLDIASELAYMIAGSHTGGHFFEQTQFNNKYTTVDPVTGDALVPTPFHTQSQGFSVPSGTDLPTLNLPRVFVLTGSGTCSASESVMNGLRGAGVTVIQIGSTTCGKPYGFHAQDNCGTTYFSIEFKGSNSAGFSDYYDGFVPQNTATIPVGTPMQAILPGCSVADDFNHALGDPQEGRLAVALAYTTGGAGACPTATGFAPARVKIQSVQGESNVADAIVVKSPLRENRWLR